MDGELVNWLIGELVNYRTLPKLLTHTPILVTFNL